MEDVKNITRTNEMSNTTQTKKVKVSGVGFENSDGSGTQTTPKKDFVVDFIKEEKGAKYPYLVEYNRGTRRYFKKIVQI